MSLLRWIHTFVGGVASGFYAPATVLYGPDGNPAPAGSAADPLNMVVLSSSGSTGVSNSATKPAMPKLSVTAGDAFGGAGPYAAYVLAQVIAANPARKSIWAQNQSASRIVIVYDDGVQATAGNALSNAGICVLDAGAGNGAQGADTPPIFDKFRGRWSIYVQTAGAQYAYLEF